MKTLILDNGHGLETPGKRSPVWRDGTQLFEYEFNRDIVRRISEALKLLSIPHKILVPEMKDISLPERVARVNSFKGDAILISVHANAGKGIGWEAWTSKGETKSDKIAQIFYEEASRYLPGKKIRKDFSDGDVDKEENFYILKNTNCPAVLTENFFMDEEEDCKFIMSEAGRFSVAKLHIEAIKRIL